MNSFGRDKRFLDYSWINFWQDLLYALALKKLSIGPRTDNKSLDVKDSPLPSQRI